ncbi:hypothetical protein [Cupriavidus plantarum]|uniref:hypothetical protein n=1 Tax=Cupriavidus plantarum TaxID=942865 RepID=UPI00339D3D81
MYVINIGHRAEHRTTLAGVLEYLNADRDGLAVPRLEDITVRHIERGEITVERLRSGRFAVRPKGTRRGIISAIIDEVDRFIVRPHGVVLRPHEMSRASWGAVVAAGRLGCFPEEAIDMSHDNAGPLFQTADLFEEKGAFDLAAYVDAEFIRRFGYGTNGPMLDGGQGPNSRHEVHVAYALARGDKVRECVINTYREHPDYGSHDLWLRPLVEVPALRGALSRSVLRALCTVMRGDKLEITSHNVGKLLSALRHVPREAGIVDVDDALYAAGILPVHTMPAPRPPTGENARPVTPLAARIHALISQRQYRESAEAAQSLRDARRISQRECDRRIRAAAVHRDGYGFEWPNRVALAVMQRDIAAVLQIFDSPRDTSPDSKRALREELGVDVLQCVASQRRRRLFEMCGFSEAEQAEWEAQAAVSKAKSRENGVLSDAKAYAEATTYQLETGQTMNGREYVDFCISAGFSRLLEEKRGSVKRYWIHDPTKRCSRPLRAKDGTLAYARARLAELAAPAALAA